MFFRTAIMVSSLLVANAAHAQDACKGFKVKEDSFSGGKTVTAVVQAMSQLRAIGMYIEVKSGKASLTMTIKEGGAVDGKVPKGVSIPFKLEDGTILTLETSRENAIKSYVSSQQIMSLLPHTFDLDRATLEKLQASPVEMVRLQLSSGEYDWSASKKVKKTMSGAAGCALAHIAD